MSEQAYVASPVGRLVWGSLWEGGSKGFQGKSLTDRQGNPRVEWSVGLAIPKGPELDAFWAQIVAKAQQDFPAGEWQLPNFSWKWKDGDAADQIAKEGRAGHVVLRLASGFNPGVFDPSYNQLIDPQSVTPGDYVRINVGVQGNGDNAAGKPGIYLNLGAVLFVAKGARIVAGPSPEQIFGAPAPQPITGAPVPITGAPVPITGAPGAPLPGTTAPVPLQPAVGAPVPPMPGTAVPVGTIYPAGTTVPVGTVVPVPGAIYPAGTTVPVQQPGVPTAAPPFLTPGKPQG